MEEHNKLIEDKPQTWHIPLYLHINQMNDDIVCHVLFLYDYIFM